MNILLVGDQEFNAELTAQMVRESAAARITCWPAPVSREHASGWSPDTPITEVARLAYQSKVDLVVLTSQDAIHSGIANVLEVYRIPCLGPTRVAAHFAWDPQYLVSLAAKYGIPLAAQSAHFSADDAMRQAIRYLATNRRVAIRTRDAFGRTERFVCSTRDDVKQKLVALSQLRDRQDPTQYLVERQVNGGECQLTFLVSGPRVFLAKIYPENAKTSVEDASLYASQEIANRFVRGLANEGNPYSGWLIFDMVFSGKESLVNDIRTLPDLQVLAPDKDQETTNWLNLIQFVIYGLKPATEQVPARQLQA